MNARANIDSLFEGLVLNPKHAGYLGYVTSSGNVVAKASDTVPSTDHSELNTNSLNTNSLGRRWRWARGNPSVVCWTFDTPDEDSRVDVENWLAKQGITGEFQHTGAGMGEYNAWRRTLGPEYIHEAVYGNTMQAPGHGWTSVNHDIDYFGVRVLMRPSNFLKLAHPLPVPKDSTLQFLRKAVRNQEPLGSSWLNVEWDHRVPSWSVTGHEGRHRMLAIQAEEGDEPTEVHIKPGGGIRRRHMTPEMLKELKTGIFSEVGDIFVRGAVEEIL
jgi:hypothetical protein